MAQAAIKATYSLDLETTETLERMARRWNVSKSEALRRAIRNAATLPATEPNEALAALDQLQASLEKRGVDVEAWAKSVEKERRFSSVRRERKAKIR